MATRRTSSKKIVQHKAGDTIVDAKGTKWTYSGGGHWKDPSGHLFNNGRPGSIPVGAAGGGAASGPIGPGSSTYMDAIGSIAGGDRLAAAKTSLQAQVASGAISQGQADAEYARLSNEAGAGLNAGLHDIAGGDAKIEGGFRGGAELANSLFAPGSLGRVDETLSPDQISTNERLKGISAPNVDPILQPTLDRANTTADAAQTLDPELQNVLAIRRGALGGLSSNELTATKELAQSGFNQSLTSAVRALRVGQGGRGPQGGAANIGTVPLTAQYANSQADLQRKLILDQYQAQSDARDRYSGDAQNIISGFQKNRIDANTAAGAAATTVLNDRTSRLNNFINYNSALRNDLYTRQLQNLNTIAAEKSGQAATIFGGGSFAASQEGADQSFELGKQNLDLQGKIYGNNNRSGGGGSSSSGSSRNSPGGSSTTVGTGDQDVFG